MQKSNDKSKFKYDDLTRSLFSECSLNEADCNSDLGATHTTGMLFQILRDLGLPPECQKRIEGTITETARRAINPVNHSLPDLPVRIFLFCNKKRAENVHLPVDNVNGGWGYYVIEREKDSSDNPGQECQHVVELYLYQEGK